jgi:N-sulfoglucosamine sulfohydrolase
MPFPFSKTQLYHYSTLTPMIFRWPGNIKPNSVDREHLVSAVDIMPTLLDAIGVKGPDDVDGRSFLPLLRGAPQADRNFVFKAYNENSGGNRTPMRAVESDRFLYIFNPWSNGKRVMHSATNSTKSYKQMVELAKTRKKLDERMELFKHRVLEEFYDIQSDPDCLVNLIDDPAYAREIGKFRNILATWLEDVKDPMLAAFIGRDDPKELELYMREQKRQTQERKDWVRKFKEAMSRSRDSGQQGVRAL